MRDRLCARKSPCPLSGFVRRSKVNHTVREYLVELERENPVEAPVPQQEKVATTDPDSTYATKGCGSPKCHPPRVASILSRPSGNLEPAFDQELL